MIDQRKAFVLLIPADSGFPNGGKGLYRWQRALLSAKALAEAESLSRFATRASVSVRTRPTAMTLCPAACRASVGTRQIMTGQSARSALNARMIMHRERRYEGWWSSYVFCLGRVCKHLPSAQPGWQSGQRGNCIDEDASRNSQVPGVYDEAYADILSNLIVTKCHFCPYRSGQKLVLENQSEDQTLKPGLFGSTVGRQYSHPLQFRLLSRSPKHQVTTEPSCINDEAVAAAVDAINSAV